MMRLARPCLVVLLLAVATGCRDRELVGPRAPDDPAFLVHQPVTGFHLLPPIGTSVSPSGFLAELSPTVEVCKWGGTDCDGPPIAKFTTSGGTGGSAITVQTDNSYQVDWKTDQTEPGTTLIAGEPYDIVVKLNGVVLGRATVAIVSGQAKKSNGEYMPLQDGRMLPIKFGIKLPAVIHSLTLATELGGSTDFVVKSFSTQEGDQTAFVPSGNAAFKVSGPNIVLPQGHVGDEFTLLIVQKPLTAGKCEPSYGAPNTGGCYVYETIPSGVEFYDVNDPLQAPKGIVGVCPEPGLAEEYMLAKTKNGVTTFLESTQDGFFDCDGPFIGSLRVPKLLQRLAKLFVVRPLYAKDEGELGLVRAFSTVHWAVPVTIEAHSFPTSFVTGQQAQLTFLVQQEHVHHDDNDEGDHVHPQAGVLVNFSVLTANGGTVPASAVTNQDGTAEVTWALPSTPGQHTLLAQVAGTAAGTPASVEFQADIVDPVQTTTSLASSDALYLLGSNEPLVLTATVSPAPDGGSVQFFSGTNSLGTATIDDGEATLSLTTLTFAVHSLTATFDGTNTHLGSTSSAVTQHLVQRYTAPTAFAAALGNSPTETQNFDGFSVGTSISTIIQGVLNVSSTFPNLEVFGSTLSLFGSGGTVRGDGNGSYTLTFADARNALAFDVVAQDPATLPGRIDIATAAGTASFEFLNPNAESVPLFIGLIATQAFSTVVVNEGFEQAGGNEEIALDNFVVASVAQLP